MSTDATIRRARQGDLDSLVRLRMLMFDAMGTPAELAHEQQWRAAAYDWFADRLDVPDARLVVAELDGRVVAGAVGEVTLLIPGPSCPNGVVGLISNVATLPPARGRGLATACTDALLAWFDAEKAVTRIDLFATVDGARIYRTRGFSVSPFPAMRRVVPR